MAIDEKLLRKARRSPQNMTLREAMTLAEQLGWREVGGAGSHKVYHHPGAELIRKDFRPLNPQATPGSRKAKRYQVDQMVKMAEEMGIIPVGQMRKK